MIKFLTLNNKEENIQQNKNYFLKNLFKIDHFELKQMKSLDLIKAIHLIKKVIFFN